MQRQGRTKWSSRYILVCQTQNATTTSLLAVGVRLVVVVVSGPAALEADVLARAARIVLDAPALVELCGIGDST